MLKIKDNVDLKELEKYGFEEGFSPMDNRYISMYIEIPSNQILFTSNMAWYDKNYYYLYDKDSGNTIYDLIKADLVEKVEE